MDCTKVRYGTKKEAKQASVYYRRFGRARGRPYRCPECSYWHLTTVNASERAFHRDVHRKERAVMTSVTAPTESAPAYWRALAEAGKAHHVETRPAGKEHIFDITDEDRKAWPELADVQQIKLWEKGNGEWRMSVVKLFKP